MMPKYSYLRLAWVRAHDPLEVETLHAVLSFHLPLRRGSRGQAVRHFEA